MPLTAEYSLDPIWSPSGRFLIYSGADVGTTFRVKAVTADGAPKALPDVILSRGARRMAFRGADDTLVLLRGDISHKEFWELDLQTGRGEVVIRMLMASLAADPASLMFHSGLTNRGCQ